MMKEEGVNIAIAFPIFGTGMRMKKSFPIFGNRNEEIMPNFWQREYEAGIPGNGQEQDVNISLFANLFIGWFQLYYFHFYCQLSWLDVIQDDLKSALATMENFR